MLKIETLSIADVTPYTKNAKKHPQEQIEQIKKSIKEFGMNDPIAIWGDKNIVVEGHGRLEALKQLGETEIECIRLDHLSDEERKAYTLAHNKLTMNSDFDFNILDGELAEILNIDMTDFGFENINFEVDDYGTDFQLADGDKSEICQITFVLHEQQKELIQYAMSKVKDEITETFGNTNLHGNEIYEVVRQWAELKK